MSSDVLDEKEVLSDMRVVATNGASFSKGKRSVSVLVEDGWSAPKPLA